MGLKRTPLTSSFRMLLILCGQFKKKLWLPVDVAAVCTENLNTGVAVMKSAQDGA